MPIIRPKNFTNQELTLDVRLETCVSDINIDFTGRKSYNFGLFRDKGIGFGITDINIEVNPSLQPIIEITFKDLYGNTIFGTQRDTNEEGEQTTSTGLDYSVLYNWPPPKFYFTFKGYLGAPVTWVLNLKKLDTGYDSSDSSYTLKASFVPNQWGVFADIPFLYLLGVKGLKRGEVGADSDSNKVETIFDYIKIGKSVDVKKVEFTKQFDTLKNQTSAVYSNLVTAINSSKIITSEVLIDGNVNGEIVNDFSPFSVTIPIWLTPSEIASKTIRVEERDVLNSFLVNKCLFVQPLQSFNGNGPIKSLAVKTNTKNELESSNISPQSTIPATPTTTGSITTLSANDELISLKSFGKFQKFYKTPNGEKEIKEQNRAKLTTIKNNLAKIDEAVQQRFINKNVKELEKVVISEIFKRLAGDTGYLTGKILEAGIDGYSKNSEIRSSAKGLIGRSFPLIFKKSDKAGEGAIEVPATKENATGANYGVDDNEMKFVEEFIAAVSEGIAENKDSDNDASGADSSDSKIKVRLNNLEMLQQNPYYSDYTNIAGNLLLRSAILGYITRSDDPNKPGSYGNVTPIENDSVSQIADLARKDMQNIAAQNLSDLSSTDLLKLKKFCTFFTRLFTANGELNPLAGPNDVEQSTTGLLQKNPQTPMSNELLDFRVQIEKNDPTQGGATTFVDIRRLMQDTSASNVVSIQNILSTTNNQMVKSSTFVNYGITDRFYHNNLPWLMPKQSSSDKYIMVLFEGTDATTITSIQSSKTDVEYNSQSEESKDNPNGYFKYVGKTQEEPLGVISINSFQIDKSKPEDGGRGRVKILNKYINVSGFLDSIGSNLLGAGLVQLNPLVGIPYLLLNTNRYGGVLSYNKLKFNPRESVAILSEKEDGGMPVVTYEIDDNYFYVNYDRETKVENGKQVTTSVNKIDNFRVVDESSTSTAGDILVAKNLAFTVYTNTFDDNDYNGIVWGLFLSENGDNSGQGMGQRVAIKAMCDELLNKISDFESTKAKSVGEVLGRAIEQKNEIYKQFHNIFTQWNLLAYAGVNEYDSKGGNKLCGVHKGDGAGIANYLEELYSGNHETFRDKSSSEQSDGAFRYDYPYDGINGKGDGVDVKKSIINIDPLYKPDAKTTVLNVIQQICQKNNFMFIPIPGNGNYNDVSEIFNPQPVITTTKITNYFHVLFMPSPASRVFENDAKTVIGVGEDTKKKRDDFSVQAIGVKFGSIDNQIFKRVDVNLNDNKPTAESIVNLQRLVSNENKNKVVTKDCSMLPVLEGRSYTATLEMLGNAQMFPLQFFYIEGSPLFNGLYQVMKVKHSINPNNMTTTVEGMRLSFSPDTGYGGIPPVTLKADKGNIISTNVFPGTLDNQSISNITANNANNSNIGPPIIPPTGNISKYVTFGQAIFSNNSKTLGTDNIPNGEQLENMKYVAQNVYDKLVDKFGASNIHIKSFFRNDIINNFVGSSPSSWHLKGSGIDLGTISSKVSNSEIYYYILKNLPFTELIWEHGDDTNPRWVHVALNQNAGARGKSGVKRIPPNPLKL